MLDIRLPLFTTGELCRIANIDAQVAKVWLQRGLLQPDRVDQLAVRKRPMFSVMGVFRAHLAREFGKILEMGPFDAGEAERVEKLASWTTIKQIASYTGDAAEALRLLLAEGKKKKRAAITSLARAVTDEGWTWAIARSVERGKPLPLLGGVTKRGGCWSFYIALDPMDLAKHFGPEDTYAVIPIGTMFARIYSDCKAVYDRTSRGDAGTGSARS